MHDTGAVWNMKHPAMGRLSYELAYVLPNQSQRVVYMTDDGDNKMLARFVSTTPGDLSCGVVWGANVTQLSAQNGMYSNPLLSCTFFFVFLVLHM